MSADGTTVPHDGVRWLSAEEQATWRALLLSYQLIDDALDRQLQHDSGMLHSHYAILAALSEAPGSTMRMSELAAMLRFSPSRMTHAVASLERKGRAARARCPDDGRGQLATLTDPGRIVLERAAPGHIAEVRRCIFDRLTSTQQHQLRGICDTILDGLDPSSHASPHRPMTISDTSA